ncbi:MAG: hypothetical protein JO152_13285 [Mycobacteriaceae bacterium]|nr:hypothetical protein [Mycobacteriaceae bacterium]
MKQLNLPASAYPAPNAGYARDYRGWIQSPDFSSLYALALTVLPNGASSAIRTTSGGVVAGPPLPTGRDGGVCQVIQGLTDLTVVSYERPESALNLSDVIAYDRMGQITAPAAGPDTQWAEFYGTDWPYNWLTAGQPVDVPVLDNGLVRVRYDSANTPGFRVDVWNGSAYVEQGKMCVLRIGDSVGFCNLWMSASLAEWTAERAVLRCVLANSADGYSRETVYVTVQRGELSVTFECYPALKAANTQADAALVWTPALNAGAADLNVSVMKVDSTGSAPLPSWQPGLAGAAAIAATAGTGAGAGNSGEFSSTPATLGASSFSGSENWVGLLRYPTAYNTVGAYQTTLIVQQAANATASYRGADTTAYGVAADRVTIASQNAAGYVQTAVAFAATVADQVLEAEAIRTASATTSQVADATASGGLAVKDTQTAATNLTLSKASTALLVGAYRIFLRVKVDSGVTGNFWVLPSTGGGSAVIAATSTTWVWLDMGDIAWPAAAGFQVYAWAASGSGGAYVDRAELYLTQDSRTASIFSGARDQAQAALYDSRQLGAVVARG